MHQFLETGIVHEKITRLDIRETGYAMTTLEEEHLEEIMALQNIIVQHLHRSDILHSFSKAFMKEHLSERGIILGVFADGRLIAFRNVYFPDPRDKEWNMGFDIHLPEDELSQVANLQMVCVHPRFRGNGLAVKMNRAALKMISHTGRYNHVFASVSPHNPWNIKILLNSGFHIRRLKQKYQGKLRYIVYRNLNTPSQFYGEHDFYAGLQDLELQEELLCSGWQGVGLEPLQPDEEGADQRSAHSFNIHFKRPFLATLFPYSHTRQPWPDTGQPVLRTTKQDVGNVQKR